MKIIFAVSEVTPFSQAGGLGDVAGSLPKALAASGHEVFVFSPLFGNIAPNHREEMEYLFNFTVHLAWRRQYCGVFKLEKNGVTHYFLDNEYYFNREEPYGYQDDIERFAFFSKAVITAQQNLELYADIVHTNDWHTALIPIYLRTIYRETPGLCTQRSVFTIHNIGYQGQCDCGRLEDLFGLDMGCLHLLEYDGCINLMKGAIVCADAVTTVSPTYAEEIRRPEFSYGLHHIINSNSGKLCGIVNGIDTDFHDPETDKALLRPFSAKNPAGKAENKAALQQAMGIRPEPELPLFAMVTRLVDQKGLDIVAQAFHRIMCQDCQLVVLGSGDAGYEGFLNEMRVLYPERFGVHIGFSPDMARRVYAGGDFFLMPSRYEPCGLAQMIAMRYGAIPVVRKTGGLADTVEDCRLGQGNGIVFSDYSADELVEAVVLAIQIYKNKRNFNALRKFAAGCDFSWGKSAEKYEELYRSLL